MMRSQLYCIVVTGGRDYWDEKFLYSYMDAIAFLYGGDIMLITGACPRGADRMAEEWAKSREQIYVGIPAQWSKYDKRAGMKRNSEMAAFSQAAAVVAFRGGRGTLNMLGLARTMDPTPAIHLPNGEFWK